MVRKGTRVTAALMTVREAARWLKVSPVAVLDLIDSGALSGPDVNGRQYVDRAALDAVLAGGTA